jgi:hypothetical protein
MKPMSPYIHFLDNRRIPTETYTTTRKYMIGAYHSFADILVMNLAPSPCIIFLTRGEFLPGYILSEENKSETCSIVLEIC